MSSANTRQTLSRRNFCFSMTSLLLASALPSICGAASSDLKQGKGAKVLVTYFSATGMTGRAAGRIAAALGADIMEIVPENPYTDDDLNWHDKKSRSSLEMQDEKARPAIASPADTDGYDIVFVGYPIWWGVAPRIINTFLESRSWKGKTIVPFCTSGGNGLGRSGEKLAASAPGAVLRRGMEIHTSDSDASILAWARSSIEKR